MKIFCSIRTGNEFPDLRVSLQSVVADVRKRILAVHRQIKIRRVASAAVGASLLALLWWCAGCASSPSQYTSPRVTGQVLNAETRQPVAKVQIQRIHQQPRVDPNTLPRGAETLSKNWYAYTDAEGRFTVDSTTTLTFLQRVTWYSVELAFAREGYTTYTTNYTPAEATYLPSGEPVVNAGIILLRPLAP